MMNAHAGKIEQKGPKLAALPQPSGAAERGGATCTLPAVAMDSAPIGPRRLGRAAAAAGATAAAGTAAALTRGRPSGQLGGLGLAATNGLRFQDVTWPAHLGAASFRLRQRIQGPRLRLCLSTETAPCSSRRAPVS